MARVGVRVLAALAPAVLLAVDPWGWYPFGPVKWLLAPTLALAGSALLLHERAPRVPRPVALALAALLGWLVLAAALGAEGLYAWVGTPERHLGVATWALCALLLVAGTTLSEGEAETVVRGLVVAGLGVGAVATAEALGWEPAVLDVAGRLSGSLGSPAYLGAATALLLPVGLGAAASAGGRSRWAAALASALLLVACLGSGARAAWLGLAVALLLVAVARRGAWWARVRARPGRSAGAGLAGLVALGLVVALSPVGARLADATDPDSAGGRGRLDEWRVAARVVADHPVVGVGPEGYRTAFHEAVDERYEREHGRRQQPDRAHDGLLDLALAGGLPLLAAWACLVAAVGRAAWRALRSGAGWQVGLAAGLVAHVAGQLLLFPIVELEPVAWLLAGVLVVTAPGPERPAGPRAGRPGLATALGGLSIAALLLGATDVIADHRADRAVAALARGDHRAAALAADSAASLRPDEVRLHLLAAQAAVADLQGVQAALDRVDDALRVSPRDPIVRLARVTYLVQRAEATQTAPHLAAAHEALDAALRTDPYAAALWRLSARLAVVDGDPELAAGATARADALTPPRERR